MLCAVEAPPLDIEISLTANYYSLNQYGIVPLSIVHSGLTIDPPVKEVPLSELALYGEDIVGQWLLDDRVNLHFYKEEKRDDGEIFSFNLTIKTSATDKTSDESGQIIHKGQYELQIYSGSMRENTGKLLRQFDGNISCD